jgi:hypothetical protein
VPNGERNAVVVFLRPTVSVPSHPVIEVARHTPIEALVTPVKFTAITPGATSVGVIKIFQTLEGAIEFVA